MTESYLITGGEGFLGHRMVEMLRERHPEARITSMDREQRHEPISHSFVGADLTNAQATLQAIRDAKASTVFHVAAGLIGSKKAELEKVNVQGTQNVIDACLACGVKKLVYTSTSGVVFDGQNLTNVDERLPVVDADNHDAYMVTKVRLPSL